MDFTHELSDPFIEAVTVTLREMAGVEAAARPAYRAAADEAFGDISAELDLTSGSAGCLVVSFPAATAAVVADRVLREVAGEPDTEMIRDCVGEVANVIAGQAKALLAATHHRFSFTPPMLIDGPHRPTFADRLVIPFDTDAGPFTLQLCLGE